MTVLTWHRRPMVGLDLETTSTDVETARIVTGCVVRYGGGRSTDARVWRADPGVEIPAEATRIHGITTEAARSAGRPAPAVIAEITSTIAESAAAGLPIVAMNAPFDLTILDREARRYGLRPLLDLFSPYVLDPWVLDRRVDRWRKGSRTLEDLCKHYVVSYGIGHQADSDVVAACTVTWKIANRYRWLSRMTLPELHRSQVQWAREQADWLRDYFARTPGKEEQAASVRGEWPLFPAQRSGQAP